MKNTESEKPDIESQVFARRRYHEVGNRRNDTVEKRQRYERTKNIVLWSMAIVFTPLLIALFIYMEQNYAPNEPLPEWLVFMSIPFTLFSIYPCMFLILTSITPPPCFGRWIIAFGGMFSRYGKSPHRFIPFSSLRNVRIERLKSEFAVITFETDQEPIRIPANIVDRTRTDTALLPFLNVLIDCLQRSGWKETDLAPLLKLQHIRQGWFVKHRYFAYTDYLMMALYFLSFFCVLPFYPFICTFSYPAIILAVVFCCVLAVLIGFTLNSQLEHWKDKKITEKLDAIKREYSG